MVEDEPAVAKLYARKLTQEGFEVVTAVNGWDGLQRALAELPDIILLDLLMPVMDGTTMLQRLRAHPWGKTVPVVVLTNLQDAQLVPALRSLVDAYVVKTDLDLRDLPALVKKHIHTKSGGAPTT